MQQCRRHQGLLQFAVRVFIRHRLHPLLTHPWHGANGLDERIEVGGSHISRYPCSGHEPLLHTVDSLVACWSGNREYPLNQGLKLPPQSPKALIELLHHRLFATTFTGHRKRKPKTDGGAGGLLPHRKLQLSAVTSCRRSLDTRGQAGHSRIDQQ